MKRMTIFEPALCCPTGICGPSVDPELLRMSTVVNNMRKNKIKISRFNLSGNPEKFMEYEVVNRTINEEGMESLPITMVDNVIVKKGSYPTNAEICELMDMTEDQLKPKKD